MSVNAEPDAPLATSEWICKVCGHDCKTKSALGNHMNGFHTLPNPMLVEGNWVSVKRNAQELLECPFTDCPNRHASRRVFQKHLTDAHSVDIQGYRKRPASDENEKPDGDHHEKGATVGAKESKRRKTTVEAVTASENSHNRPVLKAVNGAFGSDGPSEQRIAEVDSRLETTQETSVSDPTPDPLTHADEPELLGAIHVANGNPAQDLGVSQSMTLDLTDVVPGHDWSNDCTLLGNALREHSARVSQIYGIAVEDIIASVLHGTHAPTWNNEKVDDGRKALGYAFIRHLGVFFAVPRQIPWADWAKFCTQYEIRITDWPDELNAHPGQSGWTPSRASAQELRLLLPISGGNDSISSLTGWKVSKWSMDERSLVVGETAYKNIPILKTVSGTVLLRVGDQKEGRKTVSQQKE